MEYQVIHKETRELFMFTHEDVNGMDYDVDGRVIIYGFNNEVYYLLADRDVICE